jgi:type I restriction enzyme S subunit
LPIIRIQNLNGVRDYNYFNGEPEPDWIVEPGTLLFAWAGVQGVSFGPHIWRGPRGVLNQHIYRITPCDGLETEWIYLLLEQATRAIERKAHGFKSNLVHVRKSDITDHRAYIPSADERSRILEIHRSLERRAISLDRLLRAKARLRDGLAQALLTGRQRLPAFAGREWREARLGEHLTESREPGSHGGNARKLTVRLYGKGVIPKQNGKGGSAKTRYYTRRAGQLIYSKLDFLNGAFGLVPRELDGWESTLDLPAFDIDDEIDPRFLRGLCMLPSFYRSKIGLARGGRKARRVPPEDFLSIKIRLPERDEQSAIADILDAATREIDALRRLREAVAKQKRGLMQQLLTGRLRVPEVDDE